MPPAILPSRVEIEAQLERLISSSTFGGTGTNWSKLLRYAVTKVLDGEGATLCERSIGEAALGRRPGYDTQTDRIVSVTKNRLVREKLPTYYASEGHGDRIRFHLPAKGYAVEIETAPEELPFELLIQFHAALRSYDRRQFGEMLAAMDTLERIVELAPQHGPSWALLAEIALVVANVFGDPRSLMPKSRLAAAKALEIDPRLWRAHLAAGCAIGSMDRNWKLAEEHAATALRIGGSQVAANHLYAAVLVGAGRAAEAIRGFESALFGVAELARVLVLRADLALITWVSGDLTRTAAIVADLLSGDPNNFLYRANEAILLVSQERFAEAEQAFSKSCELLGHPFLPGWHAFTIGKNGDTHRARHIAEDLASGRDAGRFVHASQLSAAWLGAQEPERALQAIELSLADGEPFSMWAGLLPFHRELRGNPRFEAILAENRLARDV